MQHNFADRLPGLGFTYKRAPTERPPYADTKRLLCPGVLLVANGPAVPSSQVLITAGRDSKETKDNRSPSDPAHSFYKGLDLGLKKSYR